MNFKLLLLFSALFVISVHGKKKRSARKTVAKAANKATDSIIDAADQINDSVLKPIDKDVIKPIGKDVDDSFKRTCDKVDNANVKHLNIPDITEQCSRIVKQLNVKGIEAYVPTESEAKENMEELGKILKIAAIKDEAERQARFADHPELKKLLEKLKKIKELKSLSEKDQENTLKRNEEMLETVVRLSMLDTTNRKSPIYGKNISKLLGKTKEGIDSGVSSAKKAADSVKDKIKSAGKPMKRKYISRDGNMRLIFSKVIPPGHRMPNGNNISYTDEKGRQCFCAC